MKVYLKLFMSSEGSSVLEIIKIAEEMGFAPYVGDYDFVMNFETPEEYGQILQNLHSMLKGTKTMYTVSTKRE